MTQAELQALIDDFITTNEDNDITGGVLNSVLQAMTTLIGVGYDFMGIATPSTNPGTPSTKVLYIAGAGNYTHFGTPLTVADGSICLFAYDGSDWTQNVIDVASWVNAASKLYYNTQAGSTAAKTVTAPGFTLTPGGCIKIHFDSANTAENPTLNVNNTGAHQMTYNGDMVSETYGWKAGETVWAYYDSYGVGLWHLVSIGTLSANKVFMTASETVRDAINNVFANIGMYFNSQLPSVAAKTITAPDFKLVPGGCIKIKFSAANTAAEPTLNVNNTGAKMMIYKGLPVSATNSWKANETVLAYYNNYMDGSWELYSLDYESPDFLNVNAVNSESGAYATAALARAAVPVAYRKSGLNIAYLVTTGTDTSGWVVDEYIGSSISDWDVADKWISYEPVSATQNTRTGGVDLSIGGNVVAKALNAGYQFKGIATPTNPGATQSPDSKVFYLATKAGTYANLGGMVVDEDEVAIIKWDGLWSKESTDIANRNENSWLLPYRSITYNQEEQTDAKELVLDNNKRYVISIAASTFAITDLDQLRFFRLQTGRSISTKVYEHHFSTDEITVLKNGGTLELVYDASVVSNYVSITFRENYPETAGSFSIQIQVLSGTKIEIEKILNYLNNATDTPQEGSDNLITSGGVFNELHPLIMEAQCSFTATTRWAIAQLALKNDITYKLQISVQGLSDTDIENLYVIRVCTSTALDSYVFSHSFTTAEIAELKSTGKCTIDYAATQDTGYIHIFFEAGYTPTEGNTITVSAFVQKYIIGQVENLEERVTSLETEEKVNFLKGKTLVCFGDSITEFAGRGEGVAPLRYSDYVAQYLGMNVINVGIGGTTIYQRADPVIREPGVYHNSDYAALDMVNMIRAACGMMYDATRSYLQLAQAAAIQIRDYKDSHDDNTAQVQRLSEINWANVDYVTLLGGTNDWHGGNHTVWGTSGSTDPNTSMGAINVIVQSLLSTYPHLKFYWITPPVRWIGYDGTPASKVAANFSDNYEYDGVTLKQFARMIKDEVIKNHLPVADFYNELGWNMWNFEQYFGDNETHPFRGNDYLGRKVSQFLLRI